MSRPPHLSDWIYSIHFYPATWRAGAPVLTAAPSRAGTWHVPLWIGELDHFFFADGGDGNPRWRTVVSDTMSFCSEHHVGWAYWNDVALAHESAEPGGRGLMTLLRDGFVARRGGTQAKRRLTSAAPFMPSV